jgi:hypothetical protein
VNTGEHDTAEIAAKNAAELAARDLLVAGRGEGRKKVSTMKKSIILLGLVALASLAGCASPQEELTGTSEQQYIYPQGWDVVLTDGYGHGFCVTVHGGFLCGSAPVDLYQFETGGYPSRSSDGETFTTGQFGYGNTNWFVDRNGMMFSNCALIDVGVYQCRYFWGDKGSTRLIRRNGSLVAWFGQALDKVATSAQCAWSVREQDPQGIAENCAAP